MRNKYRSIILKLNTVLAVILFLYPGIILLRNKLFHNAGGLKEFLQALLSALAGYAITFLLCRKKYSLFKVLLVYASVIVPAFLFAYPYLEQGMGRAIYEFLIIVVCCAPGVLGYLSEYHVFLNNRLLQLGGTMHFISLVIACSFKDYTHLKGLLSLFAFLFLLLSLVLKSQENLDFVFSKRGVELPEVRKKIRNSNTKAVILFFLFVLLLLNSIRIVTFILDIIKQAGKKVLDFIMLIISLLFRSKGGAVYEEGYGFMPFDPQPAWRPMAIFIICIIVHFVVLFTLVKLTPVIIKGIRRLLGQIRNLLIKLFIVREKSSDIGSDEYVDTTEHVKQVRGMKKKRISYNPSVQLGRTSDPMEKIRLMYGIMLNVFYNKGIPLQKSDTAGQIYEKCRNMEGIKASLLELTQAYNDVRYGELSPAEPIVTKSQSELENVINACKMYIS